MGVEGSRLKGFSEMSSSSALVTSCSFLGSVSVATECAGGGADVGDDEFSSAIPDLLSPHGRP